jgi:hypothetical protein
MNNISLSLSRIEARIYVIRDQKVMIDSDLAELYEVETKNLNKAVQRNLSRFPSDFMFQLSDSEAKELLRFQIGTSKSGPGGRRTRPYAFTQEGIAMLSGILRSDRAIRKLMSIRAIPHKRITGLGK